jgi:hypothetical protein
MYMAADNELEPAALRFLEQLAGAHELALPLALQIDRSAKMAAWRTQDSWHDTRRFLSDGGGLRAVADLGQQDSASEPVVRAFLRWGLEAVRGQHTLLVFWSHGFGERAVLDDESSGSRLPLRDLTALLRELPTPIDLLALDACSMQTLPVARALVDSQSVRFLIGTESLQDADAWPYLDLFFRLAENPAPAPQVAALWLLRHAGDQAMPFTISAIDLRRVPELCHAMDKLDQGLLALDRSRRHQVDARILALRPTTKDLDAIDLGTALLTLQQILPELISDAQRSYAAAVLSSAHGRDFDDATGMAVPRRELLQDPHKD